MIGLSGKALSRAWLAVQLAVSDDPDRPVLYRAVHVEQFDKGVRLIATDSYWLARCWVPAFDSDAFSDSFDEPALDLLPDASGTIRDEDWRVRDLMKHIAKLTRKEDSADVEVFIDLEARQYDEQVPTLSPDLAPVRCVVEIPSRERVLATTIEGTWPNWRQLLLQFHGETKGANYTGMSGWMLDRLAKVARIVGAETISLAWLDRLRARWAVDICQLHHRPSGVFMAVRQAKPDEDDDTPAEPTPDGTPPIDFAHAVADAFEAGVADGSIKLPAGTTVTVTKGKRGGKHLKPVPS